MNAEAGIQFKSWRLKGLPFFKDQSFDLSTRGVSLILGKNLDSSNNNPNGAGKSMFFSELAEFILNEQVIGERKDLTRKGTRELEFVKGGKTYKVLRSFSPREKLEIFRDGKPLQYREIAAARKKLSTLLPFSRQEALSMLYIDSRVPHPLVRGSAAVRREFFLRFFRMSAIPQMRKVIKVELDKLTYVKGSLKELESLKESLSKKLEGKSSDSIEAKLETLKKRVKKVEDACRIYLRLESVKNRYKELNGEYRELRSLGVTSFKEAEQKVKAFKAQLKELKELEEAWELYSDNKQKSSKLSEEFEQARSNLSEEELQNPSKTLKQYSAQLDECKASESRLEEKKSALEAKLDSLDEESFERTRNKVATFEKQVKELKKQSSECPTCGAPFSNEHAKSELRSVRSRIKELTEQLGDMAAQKTSIEPKVASYDTKLKTLRSTRKSLVSKMSDLSVVVEYRSFSKIEKPSKPLSEVRASISEVRQQIERLSESENVFEAVAAYKSLTVEELQVLKGDDPSETLSEINRNIGSLEADLAETIEQQNELKEVTKRYKEAQASLEELPALNVLYEAFSRKGVESFRIRSITDRLSSLVNKYAKLLFPEDYTFSFDLESQFSFLVTRKYGKKEVTSDVRKLSGAESLLFNLILFIALLAFVPPSQRTNVLILDEPTATFGPEMIDSFVKFLPTLNSVVPHIIVITPMPYSTYENAKVWTVVKKNGNSRFVPGNNGIGVSR